MCLSRAVLSLTSYPAIVVSNMEKVVAVKKIKVPLSVPAFLSMTTWDGGNGEFLVLNVKFPSFVASFRMASYMNYG